MSDETIIEFSKIEYERLIQLIAEIKERLEELEKLTSEEEEEIPLKYLLIKRIYEEGGVITKRRFYELAKEIGYKDRRGPQGLFSYGGKYVTLITGDQVAVTPRGVKRLEEKGII